MFTSARGARFPFTVSAISEPTLVHIEGLSEDPGPYNALYGVLCLDKDVDLRGGLFLQVDSNELM